jgi:transcriptional regulator with XRE-family HTH domain
MCYYSLMSSTADHVASELIADIRRTSGLSQAELARRARMQSSVLSAYAHARRQPSVGAMARIAAAAGVELQLAPRADRAATEHAGKVLSQVLDLAERLPYRPRTELSYPPLIRLAA